MEGSSVGPVDVVSWRENLGVDDGEDTVVDIVMVNFAGDAFLDDFVARRGDVFVDDRCEELIDQLLCIENADSQ